MKHVDGVQLQQMWPKMDITQKISCIKRIYDKMNEIENMKFPAYGSLYHNDMGLGFTAKVPLDEQFCIGPHCGLMYWDSDPTDPRYYQNTRPNRGPCRYILFSMCQFLMSLKGLIFSNIAMA